VSEDQRIQIFTVQEHINAHQLERMYISQANALETMYLQAEQRLETVLDASDHKRVGDIHVTVRLECRAIPEEQ
jgi:hypothetical protein